MDEPQLPVVAVDDPDAVARSAAVLRAGGTVIVPTDTVYGLAALPSVAGATDELFALKDRSGGQPLAVLVADVGQVMTLVEPPSDTVAQWMATLWPGPLTLVLERCAEARDLALGGDDDTIGVRLPDHDFVRALAAEVGPIATTSANRSGEPTPIDARAAAAALTGPVDLVVDGGPAGTVASTVVDATGATPTILRAGAIGADLLG